MYIQIKLLKLKINFQAVKYAIKRQCIQINLNMLNSVRTVNFYF